MLVQMNKLNIAKKILAKALKVPADSIPNDGDVHNLEAWDSLAHVNLILKLEAELGIELKPEQIAFIVSVRSIETILNSENQ